MTSYDKHPADRDPKLTRIVFIALALFTLAFWFAAIWGLVDITSHVRDALTDAGSLNGCIERSLLGAECAEFSRGGE